MSTKRYVHRPTPRLIVMIALVLAFLVACAPQAPAPAATSGTGWVRPGPAKRPGSSHDAISTST